MSDPSGEQKVVPEETLELFNTEECEWCLEEFQNQLEERLSDVYTAKSFGLETDNTANTRSNRRVVPVVTEGSSSTNRDTLTINFGSGTVGDIVYVTVVKGDTRSMRVLTAS
jgi:hypothetical protein